MEKLHQIQVLMPDDSLIDVNFYCEDPKNTKSKTTRLFIQLDDCVCTIEIEKSICKSISTLEKLVHNKVINTKGHLC